MAIDKKRDAIRRALGTKKNIPKGTNTQIPNPYWRSQAIDKTTPHKYSLNMTGKMGSNENFLRQMLDSARKGDKDSITGGIKNYMNNMMSSKTSISNTGGNKGQNISTGNASAVGNTSTNSAQKAKLLSMIRNSSSQ